MQEVGSWPSSSSPPRACEQPVRNIRHVIENKEVSLPCTSKCSTSPFVIQLHLFSFSQWNRNMLLYLQLNVGLPSPVILPCPHPLCLFPSDTPRSARAAVLWHKQISVLVLTTANLTTANLRMTVFSLRELQCFCFLRLEGPLPLPLPHLTAYSSCLLFPSLSQRPAPYPPLYSLQQYWMCSLLCSPHWTMSPWMPILCFICLFLAPDLVPGKKKLFILVLGTYYFWFCVSNFATLYFLLTQNTECLP